MSGSTTHLRRFESDVDLFSREQVDNPYPVLAELRELAGAVYMTHNDFWLLARYDDVRAASMDWQTYTSAKGVGLMDWFNQSLAGSVLATDPPEHDGLRSVLSEKLAPRALKTLSDDIRGKADDLVDELLRRTEFDAVEDLARVFPINVVADLIGLPTEGRERLHPGADAMFTAFGPETPELAERLPAIQAYMEWMSEVASGGRRFAPGSWGEAVMDSVAEGTLTEVGALSTLGAYLTAGMDTTVNAIGSLLRLFAVEPDVWTMVRKEPALARELFEEVLRWESPLVGFFRETTRDVEVDGVSIPDGSRVMLNLAAANRDPRHYANPDVFDPRRRPFDHLAFGYGVHACAGQGLARLEVQALVESLIPRVSRFHLQGHVERRYNPVVQSWESIPVTVDRVEK
ncbi:cytochrome P450 [Mycobacterium deserti]|uniref:Cytochrome P450 n=1 Tax=Mycobacterium deserti TaxID=2978347 RepID=A0ABT2MH81_9MYCO|nr:cytochrome P450 [Mycobacterium deserti]MCT7660730.1 cytochrome P450 [Mycobacterium deserti]